jgi:D-alanyl-D-alanine carboxypeptidase
MSRHFPRPLNPRHNAPRKSIFCLLAGLILMLGIAAPALAFDTTMNDELLQLVNGKHLLDAAYQPDDLQEIANLEPSKKNSIQLRLPAAEAYVKMIDTYKASNTQTIYSVSGFRTYAYQRRLFSTKVAGRQQAGQSYSDAYRDTLLYTALPGTSEHQTGLVLDLSTDGSLTDNFRNTTQGQWLLANCWDYGFILRYDQSKTNLTAIAYEPWHYRYVGLPHSLIIRDHGWVLEEYINYLRTNGSITYANPEQPTQIYEIYWTDDPTQEYENIVSVSADNTGGYIITTCYSPIDRLLTAWAEEAIRFTSLYTGI